ncbi:MAG TPA: peptide deformylase [Candidatus Obscuribacterales bacterium]
MNPLLQQILPLGNPHLRVKAEPVRDLHDLQLQSDKVLLQEVLEAFRQEHDFGRAIAAPQIGVLRRMIALHLNDRRFVIFNPRIIWHSEETFTMWDDCMCFPSLLVRVRRHKSISVSYRDEDWTEHVWSDVDQPTSELLQHEIDHLDGVLAIDHAITNQDIISREAFQQMPDYFLEKVDYVIPLPAYRKSPLRPERA